MAPSTVPNMLLSSSINDFSQTPPHPKRKNIHKNGTTGGAKQGPKKGFQMAIWAEICSGVARADLPASALLLATVVRGNLFPDVGTPARPEAAALGGDLPTARREDFQFDPKPAGVAIRVAVVVGVIDAHDHGPSVGEQHVLSSALQHALGVVAVEIVGGIVEVSHPDGLLGRPSSEEHGVVVLSP